MIGLTVLIVVLGSILAYTLYLIHTLNLKIYQLELQVQDLKASYELQKLNCEVRYRELLDKLNHTYEKLSKLEGELLDFRNQLNLVKYELESETKILKERYDELCERYDRILELYREVRDLVKDYVENYCESEASNPYRIYYSSYITNYVTPCDVVIQKLIKKLVNNNELVYENLKKLNEWVYWKVVPREDRGYNFWSYPIETLILEEGDCEDYATLLCSLLLAWFRSENLNYSAYVVIIYSSTQYVGHAFVIVVSPSSECLVLDPVVNWISSDFDDVSKVFSNYLSFWKKYGYSFNRVLVVFNDREYYYLDISTESFYSWLRDQL